MQKMSDNDLDDLFKTATDNVQYEFKQEAWQSLQQNMKKSKAKRWGILWFGGLLILLPVIIFVAYQLSGSPTSAARSDKNKETQIALQNKENQKNTVAANPVDRTKKTIQPNTLPEAIADTPAVNKMLQNTESPSYAYHKLPQQNAHNHFFSPFLPKIKSPKPGYRYNKIFVSTYKKQVIPKGKTSENKSVTTVTEQHKKTSVNPPPAHDDTTGIRAKTPDIKPVLPKHTYSKPVVLPPSLLQKDTVLSAKVQPAKTARAPRRLSIIAQIAPDLSMVDKFALSDTRLNVGLLIEYELFKNLSVSTGINYSAKAYQASTDAYTPKDGKWKWGSLPENINATCRVLEVPINLRYYFHNQPKHRLFISTGISSYWMLSERYSFEFGYQSSNPSYSWGVDNENKHLMSILNLSAGWQKNISPRWSIQAEPFLKIPLGGVGSGKVRLKTTGILLGVKYNLF